MHLPEWLLRKEPEQRNAARKGRSAYVENTLAGIAKLTEEIIFSEEYAKKRGLLQGIEARLKLVSILLIVAGISFLKEVELILAVYSLVILAACLSGISPVFFIKRTWLFVPLFSGIVAIPAIFSFVSPGETLVQLVKLDGQVGFWAFQFSEIAITKQGVLSALLFVSRVATSVSLVVLLTLTTRWNVLMKSLRSLMVPPAFVLVLSMTYHYILILTRVVQEMHLAKKSRTIGVDESSAGMGKERDWVASRIGSVVMKSYAMSEETHSAMVSRGFRGEVKA